MDFLENFFNQPIDVILNDLLLAFGWIPIAVVLFWGFTQMWRNFRVGLYLGRLNWVVLAVSVPPATEQSPKALENLFANLIGAKSSLLWKEIWVYGKIQPTFSFEITSTEGYIQFFVRTETRYRDVIEAAIYAHYPDAEINEVEDYATKLPDKYPDETYDMWGSELVLKKDEYYPIRTYVDFEDKMTQEIKDPLGQMLEQLAKMKPGEHFWIQIVIQPPESSDWTDKGIKFVRKTYGVEEPKKEGMISKGLRSALSFPSEVLEEAIGINASNILLGAEEAAKDPDYFKAFAISPTEKEQAEAVSRKVSKLGYYTKIRIVYIARKDVYWKQARTALVKGMLQQYAHMNLNQFSMYGPSTPKDDYFWQRWVYEKKQSILVGAYKNRSFGVGATPKIFNTEELATLWHFPAVGIKAPLIQKQESRRAEPPVGLPVSLPGMDTEVPDEPEASPILPGMEEGLEAVGSPLPGVEITSPEVEEILPKPKPPTRPSQESEEGSGGDIPPNLPI